MKKLLGLLAIAPMTLAACTVNEETKTSVEADTFELSFVLTAETLEYTITMNEQSTYLVHYMISNEVDAELGLSLTSFGYSLDTVNGEGECPTDGETGSYFPLLVDGVMASKGMSSLEVTAGQKVKFDAVDNTWCSA